MVRTIIAALVFGTPALATELKPGSLFIMPDPPGVYVVLGADGCIRGPFDVKNKNGDTLFHLDAGAWYPQGCNK